MTLSNEAAERLRLNLRSRTYQRALDKALAAERRATVERIRQRLEPFAIAGGFDGALQCILDQEAAR